MGQRRRRFSGRTYHAARDHDRLSRQYDHVFAIMRDGKPRSLLDIRKTLYRRYNRIEPTQSISARLRDMRKARFGGHAVERSYEGGGTWLYWVRPSRRKGRRVR